MQCRLLRNRGTRQVSVSPSGLFFVMGYNMVVCSLKITLKFVEEKCESQKIS